MPHNPAAIQKVLEAYYILDIKAVAPALAQREQAEPQDHQALIDAGFNWEEGKLLYSDPRMGGVAALPNGMFVWMYNTFAKVLKNSEKLNIWVNGRCETFLGELMAAAGQPTTINFVGNGERSAPYDPKPMGDETDKLIAKLKRQAGSNKTLPSSVMIDVGLQAKKDGNEKLLAFLKTMKPLNENTLKKSQLDALIRGIVRGIVKEGYDTPDEVDALAKKLWGDEWNFSREKKGEAGTVMLYKTRWPGTPEGRLLWRTTDGKLKYLEPKTKKWTDVPLAEMTGTGAVGPVATPNAFRKRTMEGYAMSGDASSFPPNGYRLCPVCNRKGYKHKQESPYNYCDMGHAWKAETGDVLMNADNVDEPISEMTTTGDVSGYNVPSAFSKKGGSHKGVEGSAALGYTLTPQGKKEMDRKGDRLYSEGKKSCPNCNMMAINGIMTHEQGCPSAKKK